MKKTNGNVAITHCWCVADKLLQSYFWKNTVTVRLSLQQFPGLSGWLFTLELLTALALDLLVTSEIDKIGGACVNVQAGERGRHMGVSQVTRVHMQHDVVSLAQTPTGPHYRGAAKLQTHAT